MKSALNVIVVDDEEVGISRLKNSLKAFPEFIVVETARTGEEGKRCILKHRPDLLFLDIELPDMQGVDMLTMLNEYVSWPMQVIFYTSHPKYMLDAIRKSAFDYLLKPYDEEELGLVLNRVLCFFEKEDRTLNFRESISLLQPPGMVFMVSTVTGFKLMRLEEIGFFEYQKNKKSWGIMQSDGRCLLLKRTTKAETILKYSQSFVQINQYQIVNINYMSAIQGNRCCLLPPFHQRTEQLLISRTYMKALQLRFNFI